MRTNAPLRQFAERVRRSGGRALLVGGAVRDRLRGREPLDWDIEVYGLPLAAVERLARASGAVRDQGRAFGVLEVAVPGRAGRRRVAGRCKRGGGQVWHLSLPRRESPRAPGRRGLAVAVDPALPPKEAARRRDFTVNALAEDILTGEILDFFGGRRDWKKKVLRVVDRDRFADDPLRVLRGAVLAAQLGLAVPPDTARTVRRAATALRQLSRERAGAEWRKLLLRAERPSRGLQLFQDWGVMAALYPMFGPLTRVPQPRRWHPEGNVWRHTLMAVDEAARRASAFRSRAGARRQRGASAAAPCDRWPFMLAVLCHDLGKARVVSAVRKGRSRDWPGASLGAAAGHAAAGVRPARRFLQAIAADRHTTALVLPLVREHMAPLRFFWAERQGRKVPAGEARRLARRLAPANIWLLSLVAEADHRGRGPLPADFPPLASAGPRLRRRARREGVLYGPLPPPLRGADLLRRGFRPGPRLGELLRRAERLRDERGWSRAQILRALLSER